MDTPNNRLQNAHWASAWQLLHNVHLSANALGDLIGRLSECAPASAPAVVDATVAQPVSVHPIAEQCARFVELYRDEHAKIFAVREACNIIAEALREHAGLINPIAVSQDAAGEPVAWTAPFNNCQFQHCDLPGQCRAEGKCHHPVPGAWRGRGTAPAIPVADPLSKLFLEGGMYKTWLSETGEIMREHIPGTEMYVQKDAQRTDAEGLSDEQIFALLSEIADEDIMEHNKGSIVQVGRRLLAARPVTAKPALTDDQVDALIDPVLRAAGSALKHYAMQKSREDMRTAMRAAIEAAQDDGSAK